MLFATLSPLELMSLADRERVHTSILAWIIGEYSPLPLRQRTEIITALGELEPSIDPIATTAATEVESIDLLASLRDEQGMRHLAVEAKLRSKEP